MDFTPRTLPPEEPTRTCYLKGLKTVLGCLVALQKPLCIGSISKLLSLDDFDVPHCMKRISSLIVDGTEPLTKKTRSVSSRGHLRIGC